MGLILDICRSNLYAINADRISSKITSVENDCSSKLFTFFSAWKLATKEVKGFDLNVCHVEAVKH